MEAVYGRKGLSRFFPTTRNVGKSERIVSGIAGVGLSLVSLLLPGKIFKLMGLALSGMLVHRGATGKCAVYRALGLNTASRASTSGGGSRDMSEASIDEAVEESFPASDPPSWSPTTAS